MCRLRTAVVLVLLATVASGCGDEEPKAPGAVFVDKLGHVHAVGIDPADGATLIAAHNGLFRAPAGERQPSLVGDQNRDVMGFVVEGAQQYAGSGHPDVRSDEPSSVGFIRTTDGGRNWKNVSLAGRADLHAIEVAGKVVYAFDALSGKLLSSADAGRTWKRATVPPVLDLAIDPQNSRRVVASTDQGLIVSRDGGRSFEPLAEFPLSVLAWTGEGLTAIGQDQVVHRIDRSLDNVLQVGRAPVIPAALAVSGRTMVVAADDGSVHESSDGGKTWSPRVSAAR